MKSEIKSLHNVALNFFGFLLATMFALVLAPQVLFAQSNASQNARVDTSGSAAVAKVAPGDNLPISVKLSNFGGNKRVDVTITYGIFTSAGYEIYSISETVAVETTASFIKTIQIPSDTVPGKYIAKSFITYQGQVTPATTEFPFVVERRILGMFQSDLYLYGTIVFVIGILAAVLGRFLVKKRRSIRLNMHEYPEIESKDRIYYEILSDTIMEMRQRVGDKALLIAGNINGLKINKENGRVLELSEHPAKIIATLVSEYEKLLDKKVSFTLRKAT